MFVQEILVPVNLFVQVMFGKVELMLVVRLSNVIPRKPVCSSINFCSKSSKSACTSDIFSNELVCLSNICLNKPVCATLPK